MRGTDFSRGTDELRGFEFILWYYRHFQTLFPVEQPGSIGQAVDKNADPQEVINAQMRFNIDWAGRYKKTLGPPYKVGEALARPGGAKL